MGEETALKLYLFYPEEQVPVCVYQGEVTNVNPTINYRLVYTSEDTGVPEHYSEIDGIPADVRKRTEICGGVE